MTIDKQKVINKAYDKLASSYKNISESKKDYLQAINTLIIPYLNNKEVLDLGSGDGERIVSIYNETDIKRLTCLEPSNEMFKILSKYTFLEAIKKSAQVNIKELENKFDVVTALWNVFGHINSIENLEKSLTNIRGYLREEGRLIIDVNNRVNANSYGTLVAIYRLIIDAFYFRRKRGDVRTKWNINGEEVIGYGHIFSPYEIKSLLKSFGFKIEDVIFVNYNNGNLSTNMFNGQMFIVSKKVYK